MEVRDFSWTQDFDPSLALDRITTCHATGLSAYTNALHPGLVLEAMAQACGLHVRWSHGFTVQAYVVSMRGLSYPTPRSGMRSVQAQVLGRTTSAWTYQVQLDGHAMGQITLGHAPFADDRLCQFYSRRFHALCTRF
ncbi:hypothetical protein MASR1M90_06080 [Desulfovibrionales bacterium]